MTLEKRVLFLSALVGTGHMSAAHAIEQALSNVSPKTQSRIIDTYKHASAFFGKMATQGYLQLVKFLPQIYNFFYEMHEKDSSMTLLKSRFTQMTAENLKPLMKEFAPDVLVCTHAFSSGVASLLKKEFPVPLVSVITDFTIHPFWIHPDTDLYLVGNSQLAALLLKQGIHQKKIRITGIPVDPRFNIEEKEEKNKLRVRLGLDPSLNTVLVMGGGIGLGPIGWILRSLRKVKHSIQVIVITGTNQGLKKRMERYASRFNHVHAKKSFIKLAKIYGYVNNMYDFMKASDLLISKPGGLTSSEALAAELPMVIVGPLPGPEIRNAQYLVKEKASLMVKRPNSVSKCVDQLLNEPQKLERLKERAKLLKRPDAAYDAARSILELIN